MEQIETIGATEQRELTRIRISVRNLVEFIFRSGDIDNRIGKGAQKEAMQEGSRMHRKIQGRMGMEYRAEVPLKLEVPQEQYVLALEGRADGIITNADCCFFLVVLCCVWFCGWDFCAVGTGDVLCVYLCIAERIGSDFRAADLL